MEGVKRLVLSVLFFVSQGSYASEISSSPNCGNTFPEVQEQAYGFNYKTLNENGLNAKDLGHHTRPILRFSCDKPEKWTNLTFPEQFDMTGVPYASYYTYGGCYESTGKLKEAMAEHVDDWEKYRIGSFSSTNGDSPDDFKIPPSARCLAQFTQDSTRFEALIRSNLARDKVLGPSFLQAYKDLPEKYTENPSAYHNFIDTYGTHYWARGYYGNGYHIYVITEKSIAAYRPAVEDAIKSFQEKPATTKEVGEWLSKFVDEESQKARSTVGLVSFTASVKPPVPTPTNNVVVVRSSAANGDPWYTKNSDNFLGGWALELNFLLEDYKQRVKIESLRTAIRKYLENGGK